MPEQWTLAAAVEIFAKERLIGVKLGSSRGKWHKLNRESAVMVRDLLSEKIAELDRQSFRPNDLGNYKTKSDKNHLKDIQLP